jgi:hypothetical protein
MSDHLKSTIADLQQKLREQEATVVRTKSLINQLAEMAGMPPVYARSELEASAGVDLSIRSDQFYGQPQATAVRDILKMRKALNRGPATINEIYEALVEGGYAFETKNDENAKRGLRISISKNTALFHKLPNGKIGLLEWYPAAKKAKRQGASGSAVATDPEEEVDDGLGDADDGL